MLFSTSVQHPLGLNPGINEKVRVVFRVAIEIGEIVQFDAEASDGAVTASLNYGGTGDPMSNVLKALAIETVMTQALYPILGVAVATQALGSQGDVYIRGDIPLAWDAASEAVMSLGTPGQTDGLMSLATDNADRCVAILRETSILYVNDDASTLTRCYFDGVNGFGQFNA